MVRVENPLLQKPVKQPRSQVRADEDPGDKIHFVEIPKPNTTG